MLFQGQIPLPHNTLNREGSNPQWPSEGDESPSMICRCEAAGTASLKADLIIMIYIDIEIKFERTREDEKVERREKENKGHMKWALEEETREPSSLPPAYITRRRRV